MNCGRYWKVMDMKWMPQEVEAVIIHLENRDVFPLQYPSMNQYCVYLLSKNDTVYSK